MRLRGLYQHLEGRSHGVLPVRYIDNLEGVVSGLGGIVDRTVRAFACLGAYRFGQAECNVSSGLCLTVGELDRDTGEPNMFRFEWASSFAYHRRVL